MTSSTSSPPVASSNSTTFVGSVTVSQSTIGPTLILLLVGTVGAAFLIPLIFILLLYSHRTRSLALFYVCLFTIVLGLVEGAINIDIQTQAAQGLSFTSGPNLAFFALALCIPVIVQAGLLLRIVSVYQWRTLSWMRRSGIYGFSVALKVARITFVVLSIHDVYVGVPKLQGRGRTDSFMPWMAAWNTDYARLAWMLQLVDDIHASFRMLSSTDHNYASLLPIYIVLAATYVEIISLFFVTIWHRVPPAPVLHRSSYIPHTATPTISRLDLYPPPGPGSDPFNASRALSPLPSYPRIQLAHLSCGSAGTRCGWGGSGSFSESATLHPDSEWEHSLEKEKEKILASTAGTGLFRPDMFEPSVCSYNGSVQVDAHGEPVFYAV
ncbi:hypothetical protein C8Q79DRAFT_1014733 [Trametes meyenii]|nr:hypothetical protein C8Q79DRAFT_1014733 [Trametes meyenii]